MKELKKDLDYNKDSPLYFLFKLEVKIYVLKLKNYVVRFSVENFLISLLVMDYTY